MLLIEKKSDSKKEAEWLFVSHEKIKSKDVIKALNKRISFPVYFKQEPFILHVACRNLPFAKSFLENARKLFKKAGIISINEKKVMVEVTGAERVETIVADVDFKVSDDFIKKLVFYANKNMEKNKKNIGRFLKSL